MLRGRGLRRGTGAGRDGEGEKSMTREQEGENIKGALKRKTNVKEER